MRCLRTGRGRAWEHMSLCWKQMLIVSAALENGRPVFIIRNMTKFNGLASGIDDSVGACPMPGNHVTFLLLPLLLRNHRPIRISYRPCA